MSASKPPSPDSVVCPECSGDPKAGEERPGDRCAVCLNAGHVTICSTEEQRWSCRHVQETYCGMDGERYRCTIPGCNYSFFLAYEEMR